MHVDTHPWIFSCDTHMVLHRVSKKSLLWQYNDLKHAAHYQNLIAVRAPCDVFDPWVRWESSQVGIWEIVWRWRPNQEPGELEGWNPTQANAMNVFRMKMCRPKRLAGPQIVGVKLSWPICNIFGIFSEVKYLIFRRLPYQSLKDTRQRLLLSTLGGHCNNFCGAACKLSMWNLEKWRA